MKKKVIRFKNPKTALKELEPYIRDGNHLQTGKPFQNFEDGRSRELLANWLLCAAINATHQGERLTFTSDADGDGNIVDTVTEEVFPVEHVMVPSQLSAADIEPAILKAITKKNNKGGTAYASGKTLVVFSNASGAWHPDSLAKQLPQPVHFEAVWVVSLKEVRDGCYNYYVARLDLSRGHAPVWQIAINGDFSDWKVT